MVSNGLFFFSLKDISIALNSFFNIIDANQELNEIGHSPIFQVTQAIKQLQLIYSSCDHSPYKYYSFPNRFGSPEK